MQAYSFSHKGTYITGNSIVVAETKRKAVNMANKALKEWGIDDKVSSVDLHAVDLTKPTVVNLFDGDY